MLVHTDPARRACAHARGARSKQSDTHRSTRNGAQSTSRERTGTGRIERSSGRNRRHSSGRARPFRKRKPPVRIGPRQGTGLPDDVGCDGCPLRIDRYLLRKNTDQLRTHPRLLRVDRYPFRFDHHRLRVDHHYVPNDPTHAPFHTIQFPSERALGSFPHICCMGVRLLKAYGVRTEKRNRRCSPGHAPNPGGAAR